MRKEEYFVKASELEYDLNDSKVSNSLVVDAQCQEAEGVPSVSYLNLFFEGELRIPVEVFASDLTPLQAAVKFAKESHRLSNPEIASLLGRSVRTVWLTYRSVEKKALPRVSESRLLLPLSVLKDDELSALEAVVSYLKKMDFSFAQIARLLGRDQRTVWTVYSRVAKKRNVNVGGVK